MKTKDMYLEIMETAMKAYSLDSIEEYYRRNKKDGFHDQGFQRVVSNYGILIAKGRGALLKDRFCEMFNFCLENIKLCKGSNDFAIKELAFALSELENAGLYTDKIPYWKHCLEDMDPFKHYTSVVSSPEKKSGNWTAYALAGECFKKYIGLNVNDEFIERHIASQLMNFDENGLYHDCGLPMLYELASRSQLAIMLKCGYDGKYSEKLKDMLRRPLDATLKMQSVTGEIPFGGRSNQFLFNEAYLASVMEYAAASTVSSNPQKAAVYKRSARLAAESIMKWIDITGGVKHNKNRYPTLDPYACENYAYFDKYMASLASFIYIAYFMADDSITEADCPAQIGGFTYEPTDVFHKFFANAGGYFLEFETDADPIYDATGLGRLQKVDAPSQLIMSLPCPPKPHYTVDIENPTALSLIAFAKENGKEYNDQNRISYSVTSLKESRQEVVLNATSQFEDGVKLEEIYTISDKGVDITVFGASHIEYNIPVFDFDGSEYTEIKSGDDFISVIYCGYEFFCKTNGIIKNKNTVCANRNGHYKKFIAENDGTLKLFITIQKV